jgi:hypothetical protein
VASNVSIGTTISLDSPGKSPNGIPVANETYESILKVILLEYKNEARFHVSPVPSRVSSPLPQPHNYSDKSRRHSWFSIPSDAESLPREAITKLKDTMVQIAMGKNKRVTDPLSKRCFLHLYNDLLKPGTTVENVEELVVMFIGAATKEIKLYQEANQTNTNVFKEADVFISVLLLILKECKNPEGAIRKLEDYRRSMNPNESRPTLSSNQLYVPSQVQVRPSYRISEISNAKLIADLFSINEVKLQQDVIRLKDVSNENALLADLELYKQKLNKTELKINPDDFDSQENYFAWKKKESQELETLIKKVHMRSTFPNLDASASKSFTFIPNDARTAISDFVVRVLQSEAQSDVIISNTFKDILRSCCSYWRVGNVSQAVLLYQAAHLTILKDPQNLLNIQKTETLFGLLYKLFQNAEHPRSWSKTDKKIWITNLSNSYIQVMSSLRDSLSAIYLQRAPKLTPVLRILYDYIEEDPLYDIIKKSDLPQRWIKRLRNIILATTENKYIEILRTIPRDDTLDLIHIKETTENIYKKIQQLQKKFPKPLLGEIFIANEAGFLFIKLYCEDLKNMISHVEHYALNLKKEGINATDAIETYVELRDLRDIYNQTKKSPNSRFPLDLETFFFKYLDVLCDESTKKIFPVTKEAFEQDRFEPMDLDNDRTYSHSVLDIFKMINEIFALFKNFGWNNERQMSYIYTKLMKAVSESIVYYCSRIRLMVKEDLKDEIIGTQTEKKSNVWLFDEMKAAVTAGSKLKVPDPYSFKARTCVALNNLSQLQTMLSELETQINPEKISALASTIKSKQTQGTNNVFTISVVKAENIKPSGGDGLSSTYVVLVDSSQRKEIGKTKTIPKSLNPVYEEEFDFESSSKTTSSITATIWNHSSRASSHELLGRTVLQLDPKKFRNDGVPEEIVRDLDLQGKLIFQVSLEGEKDDILFSFGRVYRSISRTMERIYTFIVDKFSVFITYSFSRQTLKSICGSNGSRVPTSEETKDAIVPLFDYLNSNLQILATTLDIDILLKVMLQAWKVILNSADNLVLPALASVKVFAVLANNSNWKGSLTTVMANMTNYVAIPGYGRALTLNELDCVYVWLNALCDFFYNDGSGPSLDELKGEHYQRLLLVNKYYDESTDVLKTEVERLTPLVFKAMKTRNFLGDEDGGSPSKDGVSRKTTIARSNTILAYGSSRRRQETQEAVKESDKLMGTFQIHTEDAILRVLLAKGEKEFVSRRLLEREKLAKSLATERLARLAVHGRR